MFVEVGFDDAIIVEAEAFAERILGDFKSAVDVSSEGRRKVKPDGQGQRRGLKLGEKCRTVRCLC